uniref:Uncharacterized protein n=1 Tax=Lepeophtheirus salmonis TaxID=72036 RepID=A0A0K2TXC6_LEPSM
MERCCLMDNALGINYFHELNVHKCVPQSFLEKEIYFIYMGFKDDFYVRWSK